MYVTCILVTWAFNCNPTPQVFLLSASLCCSLSSFPSNDPHTSIYCCPSCIALVHSCLFHRTVACTLAETWVLLDSKCSSVSLLCVPSFLFYVNNVLLGVLVLQLKNLTLYQLKEIVLIINKLKHNNNCREEIFKLSTLFLILFVHVLVLVKVRH